MLDNFFQFLLSLRNYFFLKHLSYLTMKVLGVEIPLSVKIGKNLMLPHWSCGTVIHQNTIIMNNVKIYPGVTIGRADIYQENSILNEIIIEDNVILSTGCKILLTKDCLIEAGTIVGANAVLLPKANRVEKGIYVGIPAKKVK